MTKLIIKMLVNTGETLNQLDVTPCGNLDLPSHSDDIFHKEGNSEAIVSAIPHIDKNGDIWRMLTLTSVSENL